MSESTSAASIPTHGRWAARFLPEPGPIRPMMLAVFINTVGSGVFLPISAIYFTTVVGISVRDVALALGIASIAGMFSALPIGRLADRLGAREVQVALVVGMGIACAAYLVVGTAWQLVVVATVSRVLDRGVAAVGGAIVAAAASGASRAAALAHLRVMVNLGLSLGSVGAILALEGGTPEAFRLVIAFDAGSFVATGLLYLRIPRIPPRQDQRHRAWGSLRDRRFLLLTLFLSILAINNSVLTIGLPLWVVDHLNVPHGLVGFAFLINTVGVVLFVVPVSHRVSTLAASARAVRLAGLAMLLACALFAAADGRHVWLATALVVLGILGQLCGELFSSAAQFFLSFELADQSAQGEYQGLMSTGMSFANAVGPTIIALLPLAIGPSGWLVVGVLLLGAGAATAIVAQRAQVITP